VKGINATAEMIQYLSLPEAVEEIKRLSEGASKLLEEMPVENSTLCQTH
jgi:hypothetical protein